jgi:glycosyltransferase involved in cell wall biosynthesis
VELLINGVAATRSSLGVRRYYSGVMRHLQWGSPVRVTGAPENGVRARIQELSEMGSKTAIFWSPAHRGPLWAHNHVMTVHDCINVEYVHRRDWRLPVFKGLFNRILDNTRKVVAISEATRNALLRNYRIEESKIVVIPAGFDPLDRSQAPPGGQVNDTGGPFILMLTNMLPHKNTVEACKAFTASGAGKRGIRLRVVGAVDAERLRQQGVSLQDIELHQNVPDGVLCDWYSRCAFLFSPSLAEGFNLPVAEALEYGANVLCSDIEVHREFYQGRVRFCDVRAEESMVAALKAAVQSPGRWFASLPLSNLRSFKDTANEYRAVFQAIEAALRP